METKTKDLRDLVYYLKMRDIKAKQVVDMVSNPNNDIEIKDEDKVLIEYNNYVVLANELEKKTDIQVEKPEDCLIASKIWLARKEAIIKRNKDVWVR